MPLLFGNTPEEEFFEEFKTLGTLALKIIPNAKKTQVMGKMENGLWKIRVAAPPEAGKANAALLTFFKKYGRINTAIQQGEKDRRKILKIIQ